MPVGDNRGADRGSLCWFAAQLPDNRGRVRALTGILAAVAARELIELVFYGLRDHRIRCPARFTNSSPQPA